MLFGMLVAELEHSCFLLETDVLVDLHCSCLIVDGDVLEALCHFFVIGFFHVVIFLEGDGTDCLQPTAVVGTVVFVGSCLDHRILNLTQEVCAPVRVLCLFCQSCRRLEGYDPTCWRGVTRTLSAGKKQL